MIKADLHMHTIYSDGVLRVEQVVNQAIANGINYISITDHDCLDGTLKAVEYSANKDITVIPGIEFTSYYRDEPIHILGYFPDVEYLDSLQAILNIQVEKRYERALEIIRLLKVHFNVDISIDNLQKSKSITRGTIARCIENAGYSISREDIFKKMIGVGCKAYVPNYKISPRQAIKVLKEVGAIVVLAHPVFIKNSSVEEILDFGFDGLEAIYSKNTEADTKMFLSLAKNHQLLVTAGSDFHAYNDSKHGDIGSVYLSGENLNKFLKRMEQNNER